MSIANLIYPALQVVSMMNGRGQKADTDARYKALSERLDKIQAEVQSTESATHVRVQPIAPTGNKTVIKQLLANVTDISRDLDEAGRFARSDGVEHPEAELRTKNAKKVSKDLEESILSIERIDLAPVNMVDINPEEKKVIDHVLPQIRRLRQNIVNNMDNPAGIEQSAAMANSIATQLRVANALLASKQQKSENPEPYSKYAPTMSVDTGCIECGRAHIAMADITLKKAAQLAQEKGFASPEVQSQLTMAEQELSALRHYDWTDDKIANTQGQEKEVLIEYNPKISDIYEEVVNLNSADGLQDLSDKMHNTRVNFHNALKEG